MFGYVNVNWKELNREQKDRYGSVYCGICHRIREQSGNLPRLALRYDMAFLALLLMSLYEPEEVTEKNRCLLHPARRRPKTDSPCIRYAADMNVALAYYNCLDDWEDDKKTSARLMAGVLEKQMPRVREAYPRQCDAIAGCIREIAALEGENCPNPDAPANAFGALMGELFVWREDLWSDCLRRMGMALGRFIYLLDAALDYDQDQRKGKYNPYIAMGMGRDWPRWENYLLLAMAKCTESYEILPLVQDKPLLDNILYSGVWVNYRAKGKEVTGNDQ
jgi:hypothetical protein